MAKKADLLEKAKELNLDVSEKNTIAEIEAAIKGAQDGNTQESDQTANETIEQRQEEVTTAKANQPDVALAKAGKRSAKALKEAAEQQAKAERKAQKTEAADKPKVEQKPPRSKFERRSKNYRKVAEAIEKGKEYSLKEAVELAIKTNPVKFDATVELHVRLGVDPRQADQNVRDTVVLPAGTGKTIRVAVVADEDDAKKAKQAGADIAGADELFAQLDKGTIDFDVLVATPAMMPKLGKYARILGPKGLMPNPKSGTVTADVTKAVTEAKAGRIEYRVDSTGIVHTGIGKVSFGPDKLFDNVQAVVASLKANKPASLKGSYVKSAFVSTTMGPSITIQVSELN